MNKITVGDIPQYEKRKCQKQFAESVGFVR